MLWIKILLRVKSLGLFSYCINLSPLLNFTSYSCPHVRAAHSASAPLKFHLNVSCTSFKIVDHCCVVVEKSQLHVDQKLLLQNVVYFSIISFVKKYNFRANCEHKIFQDLEFTVKFVLSCI